MSAHTDWELITPNNLPKFGDLVLSTHKTYVMRINFHPHWTFEEWTDSERYDWKWKATFIPPKEEVNLDNRDVQGSTSQSPN